jgi:hypothetical protein
MIDPLQKPSISRQCHLLGLSRSSIYYKPRRIKPEDLELMRLIDEQYMKTPSYGSRSMVRHFRRQGRKVNRKRITKGSETLWCAGNFQYGSRGTIYQQRFYRSTQGPRG